ncbi:MAG: CAP domain-containing protein [Thermomicrobiales bacterium]|nr:CAP domain-containing protein [Thermomicrobiales bacterium]
MLRIARTVVGLLIGLTLLAPAVSAAPGYSPDDQELRFLDLINDYRAQSGLGSVSLNSELGAAADYHSQDMATHNYFDHTLSDGSDPGTNIHNFGYRGDTWGENIAAGMASADEAMVNWQNSPGHNAAMLDPAYSEIGIGRYYEANSEYGWYWTTTFGGDDSRGDRNRDKDAVPAAVDSQSVPSDGDVTTTVNGVPVATDSIENTTINGVPANVNANSGQGNGNAGAGTVTVNGVPVSPGGQVVNADGQVITTILAADGPVPITTDRTVIQEPSVDYDAPAPEAAPVDAGYEAAPAEPSYDETSYETAPADSGYDENYEDASYEAAPADTGYDETAYDGGYDASYDAAPAETGYDEASYDGGYDAGYETAPVEAGYDETGYTDDYTGYDETGYTGEYAGYDAATAGYEGFQSFQRSVDIAQESDTGYSADGGSSRNGRNVSGDGPTIIYGDINTGGIEGGAMTIDADGGRGAAPAPEAAPVESAPVEAPPPANSQGEMTTTTTLNGVTMEGGTATTRGGGSGSAQPGTITHK